MSNKAITTNDLKAVLDVVLPPQPSEYRKLLWTNPNPTSSFAAQTINLDLSDYDEVEIEAKQLASGSIIQLCRVGIGKQTKCLFRDGNANNFYTRTFITSASSVQFGDAYYNATLTNTDCVPTAIYGIKYERVAPPQVEYPNYSTEEQEVGTFIDGKTIYRKSKLYTWSGTTTYDNDFFSGISVDRIVRQRTQITKNANYAQESFYWSNTDYNRCWISLTNTPPVVAFACSQSAGCEILITVDYTKA